MTMIVREGNVMKSNVMKSNVMKREASAGKHVFKRNVKGMSRRWGVTLCLAGLPLWGMLTAAPSQAADYDPEQNPTVATLLGTLSEQDNLPLDELQSTMRQAHRLPDVLAAMSHPAEKTLRWDQYQRIFITQARIDQGVQFIKAHQRDFQRAEQEYGVPREIIAAIIGVETSYGRNVGKYRVIDSLSTLAFDYPPRAKFFRRELASYLLMTYKEHLDPLDMKGSYAGAMGYPQFMPSSYIAYAVDFNHDGKADLQHEPSDAIGSVANYFAKNGWIKGVPVVFPATGPATPPANIGVNEVAAPHFTVAQLENTGIHPSTSLNPNDKLMPIALNYADGHYTYWLGTQNFHVITRYNTSPMYAMAVTELAQRIREAMQP
ncbi:Membrane-bound lytic murein transglycosylase B [Halomonadaceae bacterium LMG 33818]|uniref:lytic murein transglycosylase B n=1 Tax=Cernens ardua TaxID=3402176 RepID=UPI003EDC0246